MYSENDHLLPEEQWAQITVLMKGLTSQGESANLYTVFERRLADKLDYFDWKISFMAEEEDFKFINDPKIWAAMLKWQSKDVCIERLTFI